MPPRHTLDRKHQGAFVLPTMSGAERLAPEDKMYPVVRDLDIPQPLAESPQPEKTASSLATDITERSANIDRALGYLGVILESQPAVDAESDKDVAFALSKKYTAQEIEEKKSINALHRRLFDYLFEELWGLEAVKAEGGLDQATIQAKFQQDKDHFVGRFTSFGKHTEDEAKANRANYRRKLDSQQARYQEKNLGVWPANSARARRLATRKRANARRRTAA